MKILAVADEESPALYDYYTPGKLNGYDLILGCGDMKAEYLTFLVTMSHARLLYVHGNHDEKYLSSPPEGCDCIDDHLVVYNGIRILGLGGCKRYHPGPFQYTETEMKWRLARLQFALWRAGGVDVVLTHAPVRGYGDLDDPAHQGFSAFLRLLDRCHPLYLLHGHVHLRYAQDLSRMQTYGSTSIINVSDRYELEIPDRTVSLRHKDRLIWKTFHREPGNDWDSFHLQD